MRILVLNGSPRKKGAVATLLENISDTVSQKHEVEWINVYDLRLRPCIGCMKCRPDGACVLPEDDAHIVGRKISHADGLIVGTPTHWGNMSSQLKLVFDRNVPVFMGEKPSGYKIIGKLACPGTKKASEIPRKLLSRAEKIAHRF